MLEEAVSVCAGCNDMRKRSEGEDIIAARDGKDVSSRRTLVDNPS